MPESVSAIHLGFPGTPTLARALGAGRSMSFPSPPAAVCSLYRSSSNTSSVSTRLPIVRASSEVKSNVVHPLGIMTAADAVKDFYGGINCRDFLVVESLIAEDCVYEDLVFPQPFVGRKAILEFFKKFTKTTSADLQVVIDDISKEDSLAVGVTWHLEWRGKSFPFSKGCSFYRFEVREGKRQIVYGRDCVEPAVKPGDLALAQKTAGCLVARHWMHWHRSTSCSPLLVHRLGAETDELPMVLWSLKTKNGGNQKSRPDFKGSNKLFPSRSLLFRS